MHVLSFEDLAELWIPADMSRKGGCYDNAVMKLSIL
jgi:hypothetical protein